VQNTWRPLLLIPSPSSCVKGVLIVEGVVVWIVCELAVAAVGLVIGGIRVAVAAAGFGVLNGACLSSADSVDDAGVVAQVCCGPWRWC
jgi:hypothetical protein